MNCKIQGKKFFTVVFLSVLVIGSLFAQQQAGTRRIGLFVGANDGGPEQRKLEFAQSDAEAVSKIFFELGGINQEDIHLLLQPTPDRLSSWLEVIKNELADAKRNRQKTELIFYYAGHSDGVILNLGSESYPRDRLSLQIENIEADARIVIFDMCYAGGSARGASALPPLFDGSSVLTSTDVTELSWELPAIRSTYFTHSLITGLRGAADVNGDSNVSFKELYDFVSKEVRIKTDNKQNPQFKSKITGSEKTALTYTSRADARFTINGDVTGRIRVLDNVRKIVVSDLTKEHQSPMELALASGDYQIILFRENSFGWAKRRLRNNQNIRLQIKDFVHAGSIAALRNKITGRGSEAPEFFFYESLSDPSTSSDTAVSLQPVSIYEALEAAAAKITPSIPGDNTVMIHILSELTEHPALSKIIKEELSTKLINLGFVIYVSSGEVLAVINETGAGQDSKSIAETIITVDAAKNSQNTYRLYVEAIDRATLTVLNRNDPALINWTDNPMPSPQGLYVDLGGGYSWLNEAGGTYESVKINLAVNKFFTEFLTREFGVGLYGTVSVPLKITGKEQGTSVLLVRHEYDVFGLDLLIGPTIMLYKSETFYLPLSAGLSYNYLRIYQQLQNIEKNKHVIGLGANISGEYHFHPHVYGYLRFQLDFGFYSWGNTGEKELSGSGLLLNFVPGIGIGFKW
jgi:hypothetical protein